jgi:transcription initiation factor TFIIB
MVSDIFQNDVGLRDKTIAHARAAILSREKCLECGGHNLIHDPDTGETLCGDCGLVLYEQLMDKGPEWRAFTKEEKASRSRVGGPSSYAVYDKGLSTTISQIDRDALGRKLPLSTRIQMWRLRKWQIRSRVHSSAYRNLAQAMSELDRLSDKAYISPAVKEKAAVMYRKALDKGLVRGRSIVIIITSSLYAACRESGTPRSLREIAEVSLVNKKDVARCYRLLLRELNVNMPIADPLTYVSKIALKAEVSGKTQGEAVLILRSARQKRIATGKDPLGIAAAVLYIACLRNKETKTQKEIAEAAGVTEVTVRNRYKALLKELKIELLKKESGF